MHNKDTVIYLSPVPFPSNSAASRRMLGNALTLKSGGYNVIVGGGQVRKEGQEGFFDYKGIAVYPTGERTSEELPRLFKHLSYITMGNKTIRWLNTLVIENIKAIILYSGYSPYLMKLLPWCKKKNIPLAFDAVEWYDPPNSIQAYIDPYYWNIELAMRRYLVQTKNIIAISSYLENYYKARNCHTVRIPPTLDVQSMPVRLDFNNNKRKVISYTGTPGHKDLFDNYLEAILTVDSEGEKMVFHVAGVSVAQVLNYPALKKRNIIYLPNCIIAEGKVSYQRAFEITREADFSILQRPIKRYAQAGFPTKVVESLSLGTPVITNHTSDLAEYIFDGEEGIICGDASVESLIGGLRKVNELLKEQTLQMRQYARKRAEQSFDYRNYVEPMKEFLKAIN